MPRPPGCGSDEPPRAGTASRSAMRGHRITSLYASEIDGHFSERNCAVKAFLFVQINPELVSACAKRRATISRRRFAKRKIMFPDQSLVRISAAGLALCGYPRLKNDDGTACATPNSKEAGLATRLYCDHQRGRRCQRSPFICARSSRVSQINSRSCCDCQTKTPRRSWTGCR
jgi:hypothetical protein